MTQSGQYGFLLVMMQPPPVMEEEFNAWYDTEHLLDRMAVPGFLSGRRYVNLDGHPRYLAMYDMTSYDILTTPAYLAVSGASFTPWTRRVTSRVLVDRRAGVQILPGAAQTGRAARLMLLRFHDVGQADHAVLAETVRAAFAGRPENSGVRVLVCEDGTTCYAWIETSAEEGAASFLPRLGEFAGRMDFRSVYAPYDPRL